ncbi:PH domain-containing protein [Halegenticoccus tardaugens]|uniref:PH domain-containing protein n=1 Tax=Halegenticoccus tardaugens TaxID=2071624 RepID=UPI0013E9521B|nr:PH domain-containing protein [Halegenticoccus tardaugens]
MNSSIESAEWLSLGDDERVLWHGRPSAYVFARDLAPVVALALVGFAVAIGLRFALPDLPWWVPLLPLALVAVLVFVGLAAYLRWTTTHYVITNRGVFRKHGVLTRDVTRLRIDRIQNTSYNQSTLQQLLSFGDLTLFTAGSGTVDLVLEDVPDPEDVNRVLSDQLEATRTAGAAE